MEPFLGKWVLIASENFDEYMEAVGVGMIKRQLGKRATPVQEITKSDDDEVTIKTTTGTIGVTTTLVFKIGVEFEETTMDGRKVKTQINLEDGKLVQVQEGTPRCKITREIADGKYLMTLEIPEKSLVCKRTYGPQ